MPAPCLPRVAALPAAPSSLPSSSAAWTDRVLPAQSVVDCFVKCGFALTSSVPDEVLDGEKWMDHLPEFKAWIASLSEKTLYKHLLESLNVAAESDEGTGLIEQLSGADLA